MTGIAIDDDGRREAADCGKTDDNGYECALAEHDGPCLPLYNGVPIGDRWSARYKAWALENFRARAEREKRIADVRRETIDKCAKECDAEASPDDWALDKRYRQGAEACAIRIRNLVVAKAPAEEKKP